MTPQVERTEVAGTLLTSTIFGMMVGGFFKEEEGAIIGGTIGAIFALKSITNSNADRRRFRQTQMYITMDRTAELAAFILGFYFTYRAFLLCPQKECHIISSFTCLFLGTSLLFANGKLFTEVLADLVKTALRRLQNQN